MRIRDLIPGDILNGATFIGWFEPHPIWPSFAVVIWRLPNGQASIDALSPNQEIGVPNTTTNEQRDEALRKALLHKSMWKSGRKS